MSVHLIEPDIPHLQPSPRNQRRMGSKGFLAKRPAVPLGLLLLSLLSCFVAFVLSLLCIFAGSKSGYLENANLLTVSLLASPRSLALLNLPAQYVQTGTFSSTRAQGCRPQFIPGSYSGCSGRGDQRFGGRYRHRYRKGAPHPRLLQHSPS